MTDKRMGNVKLFMGKIVPDTVQLYSETFWREKTIDAHFGELVGAIEGLVHVIEIAGLHNLSNGVKLGQTSWYVKASDALAYAKGTIAPPSEPDKQTATLALSESNTPNLVTDTSKRIVDATLKTADDALKTTVNEKAES